MGSFITAGALITCSFGLTPCPLVVSPARNVFLSGRQKANIMDFIPFTNISSFGMCSAPTNPEVIAATAAAMGVFTPMPCIPAIVSPWMVGAPTVLVQGAPALTDMDRNMCMWLGVISFTNNGQLPPIPPMCMAPPGKPNMSLPIRMPLTDADFSGGGGGGGDGGGNSSAAGGNGGSKSAKAKRNLQEQYNNDIAKAKDAGKAEEMMSQSLEKASKDYSEAGDSAKAEQLAKQAESARNAAADKSNEAMGDVNQCYRETMPLSSSQMSQLPPEQQASYSQMREDIAEKKEQEYDEADKEYDNKEYPTLTDSAAHDLKQHYADKEEQSSLQKLTSFFAESASTGHFAKPDINNDDIASFAEAASTGHFDKPDIDKDDINAFTEAASTGHFDKPDIDKDDISSFAQSASTGQFSKPNVDKPSMDNTGSDAQSASPGQFSKHNVDKPSMDDTGSDAQSASTGQFSKPNADKPSMDDTGSDAQSASTGQFSKPNVDKPSMDDTGSDAQSASTGQFSKPNVEKPSMDDTGSDAQPASTGQFSKPDIDEDDIASFAESASIGQFSKPNEELYTESEQVVQTPVKQESVEIEIHKPIYEYVHGKKFNNPPTWIVVHYTACINVGAESMCKAMKKNKDASSHFYIDEKDIYAAVPLEYVAWHVAGGKVQQPKKDKEMSLKELANYKHKSWRYDLAASNHLRWQSEGDDFKGNQYSIGVDFCVKKIDTKNNKSATATDWYFEAEAVENVAKTVAYLANEYNIRLGHIIRHGDATGKLCPQPYTYPFEEGDRKWAMFKEKVANYMNRGVIAKWI